MLRDALAMALVIWPSAGMAALRCVPAHWQAAETPGWSFVDIPLTKAPKSSGCGDRRGHGLRRARSDPRLRLLARFND